MLIYVVIAVFIAGLMVGRTPEYLGKKIEPYDVKMASFVILMLAFSILGFSAWASVSKWGCLTPRCADRRHNNSGPHGFSRNPLRLQLRHGQQRQRLRRPDRERAMV